jgi:tetratricopeptide (TPR) repeat protein
MNCLAGGVACLFVGLELLGQMIGTSELRGSVLDSHGKPVARVTVQLRTGSQNSSTETQSDGTYYFPMLQPGTYKLHAGTADGEANFGPFDITSPDNRKIDLRLGPVDTTETPQFFDRPSFIVAGVTDASDRGGHGSDVILHSTEALAKATASLGISSANPVESDPLEAARAYQRKAELDPSEPHLFDWGAELLMHRAAEQACEVFSQGNHLFPRSTRMLLGLAASWYSRGSWEQAERFFFEAADLNTRDPAPYLFLGQALNSAVGQSAGFGERMTRFFGLYPRNPWANYYFAMSLESRLNGAEDKAAAAKALRLLQRAVRLDPGMGVAWLQLGILFADRHDFPHTIAALKKATAAAPVQSKATAARTTAATVVEAHFRLAQAYRRNGDAERAGHEVELYEELSKQGADREKLERESVREFVFALRDEQPALH